MARRALVVVVVLLMGAVAATVRAEPAYALVDPIVTTGDWSVVNGWLNSPAEPPVQSIKRSTSAGRAWLKARRVLGRTPGFTGTLTLGAGAFYLGWEIPHATGVSDWVYGKVAGVGPAQPEPLSGAIRAYYWKVSGYGGSIYSNAGVVPVDALAMVPEARFSIDSGSTWDTRGGYVQACVTPGSDPTSYCNTGTFVWSYNGATFKATEAALLEAFQTILWPAGAVEHSYDTLNEVTGEVDRVFVWGEPVGVFSDRIEATEQRPYNASTDADRKTHTEEWNPALPQPTPEYGSPLQVEVEEALASDEELSVEIGSILHPSGEEAAGETASLPQPRIGETGAAYRTRLRALGYLGTITLLTLDAGDAVPEFGPSVVTQVNVTTGAETLTYPLLDPWPDPPPTIATPGTDLDVTVVQNPSDAPAPAPGTPGSAEDPVPGTAPLPGGGIGPGDCSCPPPDFTPITGIAYGEVFPFGVVTWAGGTLGAMTATADAPVFDFDFGHLGITPHYVVDLEVLDTYMARIRTLLSWVMWVGAVWWAGTTMLGFRATGDPGAAVDDVI